MFSEPGFLGTRAAMYMDVATVYFALLPFLAAFSIRYAVKGEYEKHHRSQLLTLAATLLVVVIFEVGVRLGGGFLEFAKTSGVNYTFLVLFLILHILVALATVVGWIFQIVTARLAYPETASAADRSAAHKKRGRRIFAGIVATSVMGVMIYLFLFVM